MLRLRALFRVLLFCTLVCAGLAAGLLVIWRVSDVWPLKHRVWLLVPAAACAVLIL